MSCNWTTIFASFAFTNC